MKTPLIVGTSNTVAPVSAKHTAIAEASWTVETQIISTRSSSAQDLSFVTTSPSLAEESVVHHAKTAPREWHVNALPVMLLIASVPTILYHVKQIIVVNAQRWYLMLQGTQKNVSCQVRSHVRRQATVAKMSTVRPGHALQRENAVVKPTASTLTISTQSSNASDLLDAMTMVNVAAHVQVHSARMMNQQSNVCWLHALQLLSPATRPLQTV